MAQFCNLVNNSYKHVKIVMCVPPGQIIEYRADVWDLCTESGFSLISYTFFLVQKQNVNNYNRPEIAP